MRSLLPRHKEPATVEELWLKACFPENWLSVIFGLLTGTMPHELLILLKGQFICLLSSLPLPPPPSQPPRQCFWLYSLFLTNTVSRARLSIWLERFRGNKKEDDRGPLSTNSSMIVLYLPCAWLYCTYPVHDCTVLTLCMIVLHLPCALLYCTYPVQRRACPGTVIRCCWSLTTASTSGARAAFTPWPSGIPVHHTLQY
jgi:hypothetical protein